MQTSTKQPSPDTLLNRAVFTQQQNQDVINNIRTRIICLIDRLHAKGAEPGKSTDDPMGSGVLSHHLCALEFESRTLGELQADLCELENLL